MSPPRLDDLLSAAAAETAVGAGARPPAWLGRLLDAHAAGRLPEDPLGATPISLAAAHPPTADDDAAPAGELHVLRPAPRRWLAIGGGIALAAAAAVAVWVGQPAPVLTLDVPLATAGAAYRTPSGSLALAADGAGHLGGTTAAPRLLWESGRVHLEIDPAAQLDVQVETREGVVAVKGTVFDVTRDARGTAVAVTRGKVEVRCAPLGAAAPAAPMLLEAGGTHTCWPTTPGGLLGRARAQEDASAPAAEVLATLSAARGLGPTGPVADELSALRVQALSRSGDTRATVDAAVAHLGSAQLRQDEVRALGAAALRALLPPGAPCDPSLQAAAARLGAAEAQQACGWPVE